MAQLRELALEQPDQPQLLALIGARTGSQIHARLSLGQPVPTNEGMASPPRFTDFSDTASEPAGLDPIDAYSYATSSPAAHHAHAGSLHLSHDRATTLREAELRAIQAAVQSCAGNLSMAARQLGIGRSTLYRKIKDAGAPMG